MDSVEIYGATPEEWDAFIALAARDVRPVVCDPGIKPSEHTVIAEPGKIPTIVNRDGKFTGMYGWQKKTPTADEIMDWRSTPALGISLVGREIKAIDIDIDDEREAADVAQAVNDFIGCALPTRRRPNQARRLMLFKLEGCDEVVKKFILNTGKGVVEFLFDRQHYVVAGRHKSGARHYWERGLPKTEDVPSITLEQLKALNAFLADEFCQGQSADVDGENHVSIEHRDISQIIDDDPEYQAVLESPFFRSLLPDGKVSVFCPWQHLHTGTHGLPDANESAVVYFPKGLGGRHESGFKCMHTSHEEKTIQHFLHAIGFVPTEFVDVDLPPEPVMPRMMNTRKSSVPPTIPNLTNVLLAAEWLGVDISTDEFTGAVQIRWDDEGNRWRDFKDADYPALTIRIMQRCNMAGVPKDRLRDSVIYAADKNRRDSSIEWLESLPWDGKERIRYTARDILKTEDNDYTRAVSMYLWTALAGRILKPGSKADMIPVLIGAQGARKSTFVKAICPPDFNWHNNLSFDEKDFDLARLTRGKVIIELPELRGLNSRGEEHIKAWITQAEDTWIPKYQENQITVKRRYIMVATNNFDRFLSDSTGNRRWLPMRVGKTAEFIDTEKLEAEVLQYWAEARETFKRQGIAWRDAEVLARPQMTKFMRIDSWRDSVMQFVMSQHQGAGFSAEQVARVHMNIPLAGIDNKMQFRLESIFRSLGMVQNEESGMWELNDLT